MVAAAVVCLLEARPRVDVRCVVKMWREENAHEAAYMPGPRVNGEAALMGMDDYERA